MLRAKVQILETWQVVCARSVTNDMVEETFFLLPFRLNMKSGFNDRSVLEWENLMLTSLPSAGLYCVKMAQVSDRLHLRSLR